ncbi:18718_t:CDS:2, partial [Racocetra persica]
RDLVRQRRIRLIDGETDNASFSRERLVLGDRRVRTWGKYPMRKTERVVLIFYQIKLCLSMVFEIKDSTFPKSSGTTSNFAPNKPKLLYEIQPTTLDYLENPH